VVVVHDKVHDNIVFFQLVEVVDVVDKLGFAQFLSLEVGEVIQHKLVLLQFQFVVVVWEHLHRMVLLQFLLLQLVVVNDRQSSQLGLQ
jgi:hypothetical protein